MPMTSTAGGLKHRHSLNAPALHTMPLPEHLIELIERPATKGSKLGKLAMKRGVKRSAEFDRIVRLPRREWEQDPALPELTALMTDWLKTPAGQWTLRPIQAAALRDLHDVQGLFAPIAVGEGKALVSLLAPVVLGAKRPVLLVPAQLRDQTTRLVIPEMRKHWRLHEGLKVLAYTELSLSKNADMLDDYQPDLIICDEAQHLIHLDSGRTRRVRRYMNEHELTRVVMLSGTITRRSILDYHHLLLWALKPDFCPVPNSWRETQDWADALDEGVQTLNRMAPGALLELCEGEENARQGYQRRLTQTPGVVASGHTKLGVSLRLVQRPLQVPVSIKRMMTKMTATWETPEGNVITEAVDLWRHMRELSCGFWYKWDPAPPRDWLDARQAWKKYVRHTLRHNRRQLDTELQVWNECSFNSVDFGQGKPEALAVWADWRDIRDTFEPNSVPVWVDAFLVEDAAAWLAEHDGIAWVEHRAMGQALAKATGLRYYGAGAKASADIADASGPIIASIASHGTGKNLQHQWSDNLVTAVPASGLTWEQMLGRTHRQGQKADEVTCHLYLHTDGVIDSWHRALGDAAYLQDTLGTPQKLLYADRDF